MCTIFGFGLFFIVFQLNLLFFFSILKFNCKYIIFDIMKINLNFSKPLFSKVEELEVTKIK